MSNSKRKCCYCKEYFPSDTGKIINQSFFCSMDHAIYYANERAAKIQKSKAEAKERKKQQNAENFKKMKARTRGKRYCIDKAEEAGRWYVRERDYGMSCHSCTFKGTQAGHYRSKGAAPHLRLYTFNMALQCTECNKWKSGNVSEFRIRLISRYGIEMVERIESDQRPRKHDIEYLKRYAVIFRKRARLYKKLRESRPENRSKYLCKFTPEHQENLPL